MPPHAYLEPMSEIAFDLRILGKQLDGECSSDMLHRGAYATDASIYQAIPSAVVYPKHENDVKRTVAFALKNNVPILARGGGTSLAGQTVTKGIVIDFTRYMHKVLEYDPGKKWIRVQPGISRDEVNAVVAEHKLVFAPDPATSSRATIGGMVANNSSGTKSILYGKTIDHVLELKVLHADGEVATYAPLTGQRMDVDDRLSHLKRLVEVNKEEIQLRFPKTMRRVSGYCLDELIEDQP